MKLRIFTDGGSKGNPGPSAIGIVIYNAENNDELMRYREDIGVNTNNDAEYRAVIKAFELIAQLISSKKIDVLSEIHFNADSLLIVNQTKGLWKIKEPRMAQYVSEIHALEKGAGLPKNAITYTHIPREKNKLADALVNDAA